MENLVPLGTGNSRLMKSNIPSNTTLAQLIQMWNNGTFPYDIGPLNPAGISQQGTPLNKSTLLKDATAALYGLTSSAVPDDVLALLSKAALVAGNKNQTPIRTPVKVSELPVNAQVTKEGSAYSVYAGKKNDYPSSGVRAACYTIMYSTQFGYRLSKYDGSTIDTYVSNNFANLPIELQGICKDMNVTSGGSTIIRKSVAVSATETGRQVTTINPPGANPTVEGEAVFEGYSPPTNNAAYWTRTIYGNNAWVLQSNQNDLNVTSKTSSCPVMAMVGLDKNATVYLDEDGIYYLDQKYTPAHTWITDIFDDPVGIQIATGSYVGTGTYGESNPNSLTFEFEPKIVFLTNFLTDGISGRYSGEYGTVQSIDISFLKNTNPNDYVNNIGFGINSSNAGAEIYFKSKWVDSEKTLYWYNSEYNRQCNETGCIYYYIAIG